MKKRKAKKKNSDKYFEKDILAKTCISKPLYYEEHLFGSQVYNSLQSWGKKTNCCVSVMDLTVFQ